MQSSTKIKFAARAAVAAAVIACNRSNSGPGNSIVGSGTDTQPLLASISVSLSATSLALGQTALARATGLDEDGNPIPIGPFAWVSTLPNVATVDRSGVVTAVGPGTTFIRAIGGGLGGAKSGQEELTVITPAAAVSKVIVLPATATLVVGSTQQLLAAPVDANGEVLTGKPLTWSSSNPAVATVSTGGLVQAIGVGTATIVATIETKSGSATITVSASAPADATTSVGR
jgi:uncharacterized protein YjdB